MGLILNNIAKSNKAFIIGCSIVSFLTATMLSIILSIQSKLAQQMQALETEEMGLSTLFGNTPNPFLSGILIIILPVAIEFLWECYILKNCNKKKSIVIIEK